MRAGYLACIGILGCAPSEPAPVVEAPIEAASIVPTAEEPVGLLVTESTFAGETSFLSEPAQLTVALDHRTDEREVVSVQVGDEFFAVEESAGATYLVRGGWRILAEAGPQTATRSEESAEVLVSRDRDAECEVVGVTREWDPVSPLHATFESFEFRICEDGEVRELSTETRFPAGHRSSVWSRES